MSLHTTGSLQVLFLEVPVYSSNGFVCECAGSVKTSPPGGSRNGVAAEGEPWLDPKYLPPTTATTEEPQGLPHPTPSYSYSSITPGVLKTQVAGGLKAQGPVGKAAGGAGTRNTVVSGKLKPATLASSYFPKS